MLERAEAQGPRPIISRSDYDTQFPLNVNDGDLQDADVREAKSWTDASFSRMRFEINEMQRVITADRERLNRQEVSLTHVLGRIRSFQISYSEKVVPNAR